MDEPIASPERADLGAEEEAEHIREDEEGGQPDYRTKEESRPLDEPPTLEENARAATSAACSVQEHMRRSIVIRPWRKQNC